MYVERKVDPSAYSAKNTDADSVRHFRRLEKRLDEVYEALPKKHLRDQFNKFWTKRDEHISKLATNELPNLWQPVEKTKPYDPMDLDTDEDFGKAVSYVSSDTKSSISEDPAKEEELEEEKYPVREILKVGRHTQMTTAGRIYSFSALVLLGTGKGTAGLGYGRGTTVAEATLMAKRKAERGILSLKLHRGNSIGRDIKTHYKRSFVWMKQCRSGHGVKCSPEFRLILDAFGITDITIGKGGSRNRHTVYRALFKSLRDGVRTPEDVARMLGRKLFDRSRTYYYQHE
jgi:small subunit ribosomal protein S5